MILHAVRAAASRRLGLGVAALAFIASFGVACAPGDDAAPAEASSEVSEGANWTPVSTNADAIAVIKKAIADQKGEAAKGHAKASVNVARGDSDAALDLDARNAMLNAVLYDQTKNESYAKGAVAILGAWAQQKTTFSGDNGFLVASWDVSTMARAAQILKMRQAPGWKALQPSFEAWVRQVAEDEWLPNGEAREGTTPNLSTSNAAGRWELTNVTNRTLTMIEATMHVARLVGDLAWFERCVNLYKSVAKVTPIDLSKEKDPRKWAALTSDKTPTYFIDDVGRNADEVRRNNNDPTRNDEWHPQAGLAAAVQIAELAKSVNKPDGSAYEDLYALSGNILKTSVERYAAEAVAGDKNYIPFFRAAVNRYGAAKMPSSVELLGIREDGTSAVGAKNGKADPVLNFLCYNWGFYEYL